MDFSANLYLPSKFKYGHNLTPSGNLIEKQTPKIKKVKLKFKNMIQGVPMHMNNSTKEFFLVSVEL